MKHHVAVWNMLFVLMLGTMTASLFAGDGNRLTYLDENNPYYPHKDFPKLITPQWVGEEGVEAVVILAIDDMRDTQKYEDYLRPILIRLKQIDGRAPVSIMTNSVDPKDEQLQQWLAEGLSIECHTIDHPCPLLQGGDFAKAKSTYDRCIDLLNEIPNNKPVAFRMPCCDSLNTVSPRFYAEIFNKTTEKGNSLQISSSVFNIFTSDDPDIPRELVLDADGGERFRKYIPRNLERNGMVFDTFVNTIENYPYPYVINRLCWEFPCVIPSDWEAQHLHGPNNPQTVADMKAALDITVLKQGVFCLVFHPHGWIRNVQVVELIDHAVRQHGEKVKFLTFKEALARLNKNVLHENSLRTYGLDNCFRLLDVNNDGFLDVFFSGIIDVFGDMTKANVEMWSVEKRTWHNQEVGTALSIADAHDWWYSGARFGLLGKSDNASLLVYHHWSYTGQLHSSCGFWRFVDGKWLHDNVMLTSLRTSGQISLPDFCKGVRFRDLDRDGVSELVVGHPDSQGIYQLHPRKRMWKKLPFALPKNTEIVERRKADSVPYFRDNGLRFVDINEDGYDDIVFSNHERYGIWLFQDMQTGWSIELMSGVREKPTKPAGGIPRDSSRGESSQTVQPLGLPPIVRADGTDNGFFIHSRHLFWQNEDTAHLPDLVDRRSFDALLKQAK